MISVPDLRKFVFKAVATGQNLQYIGIREKVGELAVQSGFSRLDNNDELNLNQIIWDLVIERILTFGTETRSEPKWPFIRVTDHGKAIISSEAHGYYDPDEYVNNLEQLVPSLDEVISQYALESLRCFRQNLIFASAVMIGAAAERAMLLLLEAIGLWVNNEKEKQTINAFLDRPRLPQIFDMIRKIIKTTIDQNLMPYSVHEGVTEHFLSLYEMIRVQRNDAVHPAVGEVSRNKVFLSIQTFPVALEVLFRVNNWFLDNCQ